jgi:predicted dehydrogenase
MENNRRNFLKKLSGTAATIAFAGTAEAASVHISESKILKSNTKVNANDKIRIGLIGAGIIGHFDTDTALKVPGVELVAACDLYQGRLDYAREKWGKDIFLTKDYREILAKKDIDAVLICTPDHWHQRIGIAAMQAGKHVYCEKPMVQKIEEGAALVQTQKETGKVFQVGSQRASSVAISEAKKLLQNGTIGELTMVNAFCDRSDSRGAWNYAIPTDASPATVDFDTFLGHAPKVPFDAKRFFRWRNFKDYGTGAAGDLIVHLLTGIHTMTDSLGPNKIFSAGGLKLWKDGRDAFDNINALMTYPDSKEHKSFNVVTRVNLTDGEGKGEFGIKLIGTEGCIDIGWNEFKVRTLKRHEATGYGGYDSYESFSAKQKEDFKKWYKATYGDAKMGYTLNKETAFNPEKGYDDRLDHLKNFFNSVRTGSKNVEDVSFGFRAAAPSIACNISIETQAPVLWDPVTMKLV